MSLKTESKSAPKKLDTKISAQKISKSSQYPKNPHRKPILNHLQNETQTNKSLKMVCSTKII